ncbi:MAG: hypothetical protein ACO3JL_11455 [Myxococcota bacterium]
MFSARALWVPGLASLLLCATGLSQSAPAPTSLARVEGLLRQVQQALQDGALARATTSAEDLLIALREEAPLRVRRALLVARPPTGLGVYEVLPGDVVRGREAYLYVEVEGFHRRPRADGSSEVSLTVTGDFFLDDGSPLGSRALGTHTYVTHTPHALTFFSPQLQLSERAPAGVYRVDVRVRDDVSGKTTSARVRLLLP